MDKTKLDKVDIRNIVYNHYNEFIDGFGDSAGIHFNRITKHIAKAFKDAKIDYSHYFLRQYLTEYILEKFSITSFGIQPTFEAIPQTRTVIEILNDLVVQRKLDKNWGTI